jgi:hypothetical protein
MLVVTIVGYKTTGLTYHWTTWLPHVSTLAGLLLLWGYFVAWPGRQSGDFVLAEMFLGLALILMLSAIAPAAQYPAIALRRPLVDSWLAGFDDAIGVRVPTLAAWTQAHPAIGIPLLYAYNSFPFQFFLPPLALGLLHRNRAALWEFLFHLHVCTAVTAACVALWPAGGVYRFYNFTPAFDESHVIAQFEGLYSGSLKVIESAQLDGLISLPSFHTALAVIATWALWKYRFWRVILVPLNLGLIAATVFSGAHYVADLPAAVAMCGLSLWLYRRYAVRLLDPVGVSVTALPAATVANSVR